MKREELERLQQERHEKADTDRYFRDWRMCAIIETAIEALDVYERATQHIKELQIARKQGGSAYEILIRKIIAETE